MSERICMICGKPESEHCTGHFVEWPEWCKCDPLTWDGDKPDPVCEEYVGNGECYCRRCNHDKECHSKGKT